MSYSEILQPIINWFTDRDRPLTKRILIGVLSILIIFLVDNIFGFSYILIQNIKVNHVIKLEEAKNLAKDDIYVLEYLSNIERSSIERMNIFQRTLTLLENSPKTSDIQSLGNINNENIPKFIEQLPEMPIRSKRWNTITATPIAVYLLIISFVVIIFAFTKNDLSHRRIIALVGLFMIFLSLSLGWIIQFILGSIPVIYDRAYINYTINILINVILFIITYINLNKKKNNKETPCKTVSE